MNPEDQEGFPFATITIEGGDQGTGLAVTQELPDTMMVFPLRQTVPFPNLMMPILLDSERARDIVAQAEAQHGYVLLLVQRDGTLDEPGPKDFYEVGVIARIVKTLKLPDGNSTAMAQGMSRAKVVRFLRRKKPLLVARTSVLVDIPISDKRGEALFRALSQNLQRMVAVSDQYGADFSTAVLNIEQADQLADFAGSYFIKDFKVRQRLLAAVDVAARVEIALEHVMQELELAELGNRIQEEIREKTEKAQKDYFLREQIKIIQRELGEERDVREAEVQRFEEAIAAAGMPDDALARAQEELNRLRTTPVESGEYSVVRNYLDWLVSLPWSVSTEDVRKLSQAREILDEDHYGLEDVKDRILEFLAVRKLKPGHQGSILCFSGPPGVGKTSLGRSIARAMGREFWRFSLGGMRDEAEIKGHRRTYIGAMPGRLLQGLKSCGSNNPVIMLDELDKLGSDFRGDPSSALLEVLDPEQNNEFLDHYLDVPFDLSNVMFLATANVLPQIPEPLRDRMEVIALPGYLLDEKVQIATRHLVPKQLDRHGLLRKHLTFGVPVLKKMILEYTRESGVRGLEKTIQRACRKAAVAVANRRKPPGRIKMTDLAGLLGPVKFPEDARRRVLVPGVIQGLAWTPHGGDVLLIEVATTPGKGRLTLTGSLGDVMSESCRIALGYLRSRCDDYGLTLEQLDESDVHVHFPAGAIPKDGPSAGIAIASALVSALLDRQVRSDIAMTGELTLMGEVLPIGGVREKVIAAHRLGIKRVILPDANRRDVEELKPGVVKGVQIPLREGVPRGVRGALPIRAKPRRRPQEAVGALIGAASGRLRCGHEAAGSPRSSTPGRWVPDEPSAPRLRNNMSESSWFHHLCLGSAAVLAMTLTSCNQSTKNPGVAPRVTAIPEQDSTGGEAFELDLSEWVEDPASQTITYTVTDGGGSVSGTKYQHTFETVGSKTVKLSATNGIRTTEFSFIVDVETSDEAVIKSGTSVMLLNRSSVASASATTELYGDQFITVSNAQGATDTFKAGLTRGHMVFERKQGNQTSSQVDLYLFDAFNRTLVQLGDDPQKTTNELFEAKTSKNQVVFTSGTDTDTDLYIHNALTELTREISAVKGAHERNAKVDAGDLVYFESGPTAQRNIYVYDPAADELDPISTSDKNEIIQGVVSGGGVVFTRDEGAGDVDLWFYKVGVGLAQVASDVATTGFQAGTLVYNGSTSDGKVVFTHNVSATDTDLYLWDPATLVTTAVATNAGVHDRFNGVTTNKKIIYTHEVSATDWDIHAWIVGTGDQLLSGVSAAKDTFQTVTALDDVVMLRGANDMHVWDDSAATLLSADVGDGAALTFVKALDKGNIVYTKSGTGLMRWDVSNAKTLVSPDGTFVDTMYNGTDFVVKRTVTSQDDLSVWLEATDVLHVITGDANDDKFVVSTTQGDGAVFSRKGTNGTYDLFVWDNTNGVRRLTNTSLDHTLAGTYSVDNR